MLHSRIVSKHYLGREESIDGKGFFQQSVLMYRFHLLDFYTPVFGAFLHQKGQLYELNKIK